MKKTIALLMALLIALSVSGCAESLQQIEIPPFPVVTPTPEPATLTPAPAPEPVPGNQTVEPQPTGEAQPTEVPAPVGESASRVLVTNGNTTLLEYDPAEGTKLILTFAYDMPRVYAENYPEATGRINETLATLEEIFYTGNSYGEEGVYAGYSAMLEMAEDNYAYVYNTADSGLPLEFSDTLTAKVKRADDSVLSILYAESRYNGDADDSYALRAYNFDMTTGETLRLEQLSEDYDALAESLVQYMLELASQDADGYYSERLQEPVSPDGSMEEAFRALLREGSWCFDRDGMVIFSALSGAAGIVEFHIPYAALEGKIDARWLYPTERQGKGKLSVCELDQLEGGDTEIVDKLTVNEGGQNLCVVVDGRVYDVSVSTVYYVDRFYENAQLWYASTLSDCALQLEVVVPEGLPNLLITYYTADGVRHGKLLSQSGADGSYLLVDDDIKAVG